MIANTVVTIMRGESTDAYGDPYDNASIAASGVRAAITERSRQAGRTVDGQRRVIRTVDGRLPAGTDVRTSDRLVDADGTVFTVDSVDCPRSFATSNDVHLILRRVTA